MGLIGIRYGKVVHRPSCPAWAKIASVPKAASPSANRITAATDHRFTVFCPASSVRIRSSPRRVLPAPLPRTRHLLKLAEKLRRIKYTPHGHSASLLYSIFLGGIRTGEKEECGPGDDERTMGAQYSIVGAFPPPFGGGNMLYASFFAELLRQRAGSNLELDNLARVSLTAFHMERSASSVRGPDAFPFPTGTRIIDAAIDSFCIEAHRIRDAEAEELAIHQRQESLRLVSCSQRNILAHAEHVEPVHEIVVGRVGAAIVNGPFVVRAWEVVQSPAFGAVLSGRRSGSVQRTFTLAPIETGVLSARQHRPYDVIAVHVHAARCKPLARRLRVLERHFVVFRKCCRFRMRPRDQANDEAGHAKTRSQYCAILRTRSNGVERRIDPLVFLRIERLVWFYVIVPLAVRVAP